MNVGIYIYMYIRSLDNSFSSMLKQWLSIDNMEQTNLPIHYTIENFLWPCYQAIVDFQ